MQSFIKVKNLFFKYEKKEILKNINLDVKRGEFISIIGRNGCGKSTLVKHFNALLLPEKGEVLISGMNTKDENSKYKIRQLVGLVLQNPENQIVASVVEEDVAFGPENLGIDPKEIRERVDYALKAVDMYDYKNNAPYKLSGGQKQRVAIAGILAMSPECIVLDEPTAMLDPQGRDEVMNTIKKLNKEKNITVVLITHYMNEAAFSDRIVVMADGGILKEGSPYDIFSRVSFMKENGLDVPQSCELIDELNKQGYNISKKALNSKECVKNICDFLEDSI